MGEKLGKVALNQIESIWLSLQEIRGEPHLELRVHTRATPGDLTPLSGGQAIALPVGLLPELLRVMTAVQDLLMTQGLIPRSEGQITERENPISVRRAALRNRTESRRHPRMHLCLPVECRMVDPNSFWPGKRIVGELKDVSIGGAQLLLPERLPRFKQVEVFAVIEGRPFRGRAEIVGAELQQKHPNNGHYRHSLRWVGIDAHTKAALSKIVPMMTS